MDDATLTLPMCDRCKKSITDIAFIMASPSIVLNGIFDQSPAIFKCKEHAENFAKHMKFHSDCWMDELKDHGVPIHNMTEIIAKYNKTFNEALIKDKK